MIKYVKFEDYDRFFMFSRTYAENLVLWRDGYLTDKDWKHFRFYWCWCLERFSSDEQDMFYAKHGREKYLRRIERVQRFYRNNIDAYKWKFVNKPSFNPEFVVLFPDIVEESMRKFYEMEKENGIN